MPVSEILRGWLVFQQSGYWAQEDGIPADFPSQILSCRLLALLRWAEEPPWGLDPLVFRGNLYSGDTIPDPQLPHVTGPAHVASLLLLSVWM